MQIVINIPEDTYQYYVKLANKGEQLNNLERIILNCTPQPKTGHWIDGEKTRWKCSGCEYGVLDWNTTPYCPNCGRKMKIESEDKE